MQAKTQLLVYLLLVTCAASGCREPSIETAVRPVRAIRVGDVEEINGRSFPGQAQATESANLSFRVAGPLKEFPVKVGDQVTRGQLLARIDARDFEVALENAQGELARAEANLDAMKTGARPEELEQLKAAVQKCEAEYNRAYADYQRDAALLKKDAVTQAEYDRTRQMALRAQAELRTAEEALRIGEVGAREEDIRAKEAEIRSLEAAVTAAQDQLDYTELKAPFDGVVAATFVENFETVQAKQQILRLLDISSIEITIEIPESLISNVEYVRDLTCVFDAFTDTKIEGVEVKEVGTEASAVTRTFPVTLIMDQPDQSTGVRILPGMAGRVSGRAKLPDQVEQQGLDVPETAVFSGDGGRQFVWVIDENSMTVRPQAITPGELTTTGMRVTGVKPGQLIATAGVHYLQEGQEVRIHKAAGDGAK